MNPNEQFFRLRSPKATIKSDDKTATIKSAAQKAAIVEYLTDHASGKTTDFTKLLDLKNTRVKALLSDLIAQEIIVAEGNNRNRIYRLKS